MPTGRKTPTQPTNQPRPSTMDHRHVLWSTTVHYGPAIYSGPRPSTMAHCHLLWSTTVHYGPLPSTLVHDRPLWPTAIYSGPRPSTMAPPSTLVHDRPLWPTAIYSGPRPSTMAHRHLLWSTTVHYGPLPSTLVHDRPLWPTAIYSDHDHLLPTRGYNNIQCKDASLNSYVSRYRGNTEVSYTFKTTLNCMAHSLHFTPSIKYTLLHKYESNLPNALIGIGT